MPIDVDDHGNVIAKTADQHSLFLYSTAGITDPNAAEVQERRVFWATEERRSEAEHGNGKTCTQSETTGKQE